MQLGTSGLKGEALFPAASCRGKKTMAQKKRQKLGQILVESGVITDSGVGQALEHAKQNDMRIGEAMVALGLVDEEELAKAVAIQSGMEYVDLDPARVAVDEGVHIPEDLVREHLVLPTGWEDGRLKVIVTDPHDSGALKMLRARFNCELSPCVASKSKFLSFIEGHVDLHGACEPVVAESPGQGQAASRESVGGAGKDELKTVRFRLPKGMLAKLKALAAAADRDQAAIVKAALEEYFPGAIDKSALGDVIEKLSVKYRETI